MLRNLKKKSMWKLKHLKVFNHRRRHCEFNCHFFLHVHAIEGLPSGFNGQSLRVKWQRKDRVLQTRPIIVSHGNADFGETLIYKSSIDAYQDQIYNTISYESKFFRIYISAEGVPGGIHWIDFSRFLPLTSEELEEKRSGKRTEILHLTGNASGATLTVSYVFYVMGGHHPFDSNFHMSIFRLLNQKISNIIDHASDRLCVNCGSTSCIISEVGSNVSTPSDNIPNSVEIFAPAEPTLDHSIECPQVEIEDKSDSEEITVIDRDGDFPDNTQPEMVNDNPGHVEDEFLIGENSKENIDVIPEPGDEVTEPGVEVTEPGDEVTESSLEEFLDEAKNEDNTIKMEFESEGKCLEEDEEELDLPLEEHSMRNNEDGKMVELLETETLMEEQNLGENAFSSSTDPSLFGKPKNEAQLILQVSISVVLPLAMGSSIMEILEHWASVGQEKMFTQLDVLMPWEDFNRKEMNNEPERLSVLNRTPDGEVESDFVSIEDVTPLAMEKIEALSFEGLKIQSGMSSEEAPSIIRPQFIGRKSTFLNMEEDSEERSNTQINDVDEIINLSITLDEWMKLDSGNLGFGDVQTSKVNLHEHAASFGETGGILGNIFTVATRVQLRDPHHEFETVGEPMVALIQVERAVNDLKPRVSDTISDGQNNPLLGDRNQEEVPLFKIIEVNVAGFATNPIKGEGASWLVASEMQDHIQSKVWSISAHVHGPGAHWKEVATQTSHIRNPDVVFLS